MIVLPRMSAVFSEDRVYRYRLDRHFGESHQMLNIIGLNPSTADESTDDPTIRRCLGFAQDWGFGSLVMTNLFAFRETNPAKLTMHDRLLHRIIHPTGIVGDENDYHILDVAHQAGRVLLSWGRWGSLLARDRQVIDLLRGLKPNIALWCFGKTASGHPRHPLYLPRSTEPQIWR